MTWTTRADVFLVVARRGCHCGTGVGFSRLWCQCDLRKRGMPSSNGSVSCSLSEPDSSTLKSLSLSPSPSQRRRPADDLRDLLGDAAWLAVWCRAHLVDRQNLTGVVSRILHRSCARRAMLGRGSAWPRRPAIDLVPDVKRQQLLQDLVRARA